MKTQTCLVCSNPEVSYYDKYCAKCWSIVPQPTRYAYDNGQAKDMQMVEIIRLRSTSIATLRRQEGRDRW